jgi:hypothetical protein
MQCGQGSTFAHSVFWTFESQRRSDSKPFRDDDIRRNAALYGVRVYFFPKSNSTHASSKKPASSTIAEVADAISREQRTGVRRHRENSGSTARRKAPVYIIRVSRLNELA